MKKITLLLFFILSLHQLGFACRCASPTKTFCDEAISINENHIIARIQIESKDGIVGQARILNLYKGTEDRKTIQIWGGTGSGGGDCIYTIGNVGQIYIIILYRFNQTFPSSPAIKAGDYSMGGCSNTILLKDGGKIKGRITQLRNDDEIDDIDPTSLSFCPQFKSDAQELQTIQIAPNPTSNNLTIRGLISDINISIFDAVGRLVSEQLVSVSNNILLVGDLSRGLYIIRYRRNTEIRSVKFVKT
jgi:Secretion system C-terminal sorting domain